MNADNFALPALIRKPRSEIIWKPQATSRHLLKRKLRGHLPPQASISDYESIIKSILGLQEASIYVYYAGDATYLSVAGWLDNRLWLVIASLDGVMETAFVVENSETYLDRAAFEYVGKISEVVK